MTSCPQHQQQVIQVLLAETVLAWSSRLLGLKLAKLFARFNCRVYWPPHWSSGHVECSADI